MAGSCLEAIGDISYQVILDVRDESGKDSQCELVESCLFSVIFLKRLHEIGALLLLLSCVVFLMERKKKPSLMPDLFKQKTLGGRTERIVRHS